MLDRRQQDVEERSAAACSRLKGLYEEQKRDKEARATERTSKLPSSKRHKTAAPGSSTSHVSSKPSAWAGSNYTNTGSGSAVERPKGQVQLIKQLGIVPSSGSRSSSGGSSSKPKILPKVTVTRTHTRGTGGIAASPAGGGQPAHHSSSSGSGRQQQQRGKVTPLLAPHLQRQQQQQQQQGKTASPALSQHQRQTQPSQAQQQQPQQHSNSSSSSKPGLPAAPKHPQEGPSQLPHTTASSQRRLSSPPLPPPSKPALEPINLTFRATSTPHSAPPSFRAAAAAAADAAAAAASKGGFPRREPVVSHKFAGSGSTKSAQLAKPQAALPGYGGGLCADDDWDRDM
ncbi:MAG: hypothetical protein WDW36_000271 [Sanguina aurantia]